MPKKEQYKKFDNTQKKLTPAYYLGRQPTQKDLKDPEYHMILKSLLKTNIKFGVDSLTHQELEGFKPTFGYEIETVSGRIPDNIIPTLNVKAVHDGSLRDEAGNDPIGGEYVTGVLYGDAGFKHLYDICKVLNEHCDIDHRAGVHVHIGSLGWTKEDVVYCYILAQMIEQEMFDMLPKSRATNEYCRKISKLISQKQINLLSDSFSYKLQYETVVDSLFDNIFIDVSGGTSESPDVNKRTNHPRGSKCNYDKKSQRYCWLNFVTLLFNTKGVKDSHTLEIRSHSATLDYKKIKNWAKIWSAFCKFVTENKRAILTREITIKGNKLPVNLETICLAAYPNKGDKLVEYIKARKNKFKTQGESSEWTTTKEVDRTIKQVLTID